MLKWDGKKKRFVFHCGFHDKSIPKAAGFRWDMNTKEWYTIIVDVAMSLSKYASDDLKRAFELVKKRRERNLGLSKATEGSMYIPAPEGLDYYPYQKAGIEYAVYNKNTYIADEMGLGKTIQAIGAMNVLNPSKTLVVCPASLKYNWKKEIEMWSIHGKSVAILNKMTDTELEADVYIVNYAMLWRKKMLFLKDINFDLIIADEVHYAKNNKAKRSKAFYALKSERKIYLSGTPMDKPIHLFHIIKNLGFKMSWKAFTKRYCNLHKDSFGHWNYDGSSNLPELQHKMRYSFMVRRLKNEVLTDLPPKQRSIVALDPEKYKSFLANEKDVVSSFDSDLDYDEIVNSLKSYKASDIGELAKARHDLALAKVGDVVEIIDTDLESTNKVVVFAHHKDVIDAIMDHYGDSAVKIVGGMSEADKDNSVTQFQTNDDVKVFVGNFVAAGVGLTLTESSTVIFAELDWTPSMVSQCEDRCHRIGQTDSVTVKHIVVDGSIDSMIAKAIIRKQKVAEEGLNHTSLTGDENLTEVKDLDLDTLEAKGDASREAEKSAKVARKARKARVRAQRIAEGKKVYSDSEKQDLLKKLRTLSSYCDGANASDGMGFNKFDTRIGKSLAALSNLTDAQAEHAEKLARKYRRQLS